MLGSSFDLNEFRWEWPERTCVRRRSDDVVRPRNDLGSDFLFDSMWMNGFRLFDEREEDTDFLMAMFPSLFSFLLTTDKGGGMSAVKWWI